MNLGIVCSYDPYVLSFMAQEMKDAFWGCMAHLETRLIQSE